LSFIIIIIIIMKAFITLTTVQRYRADCDKVHVAYTVIQNNKRILLISSANGDSSMYIISLINDVDLSQAAVSRQLTPPP